MFGLLPLHRTVIRCAAFSAGAVNAWPALRLWEGDAGIARLDMLAGAQSVQVVAEATFDESWKEFAYLLCRLQGRHGLR